VFAAPKSVSVLFALADAPVAAAALAAQRAAVAGALAYVEERAVAVRRGSGEERSLLATAGVVGAAVDHDRSRAGDPHLHTHVVVANLAHGADGRWGAIDGRGLFAHAQAAGHLYQAHLRHELSAALGVGWRRRSDGRLEVAGVSAEAIAAFSGRRAEIAAARTGRRRSDRVAWAATREHAVAGDLRSGWRHRAAALGLGPALGPEGTAAPAGGRGSGPGRPALDERHFARQLGERAGSVLHRRDAMAAWSNAVEAGAPAPVLRSGLEQWLGTADAPGVGEAPVAPADLVPPGYLVAVLGPRPADGPGVATWLEVARAVDGYRRRFGVAEAREPLGQPPDGPGLATVGPDRLAAHLALVRKIDRARLALGRPRWREVESPERSLDR
jgi:hypothetical protein